MRAASSSGKRTSRPDAAGGGPCNPLQLQLVFQGVTASMLVILFVCILAMWISTRSDVADVRTEYFRFKDFAKDAEKLVKEWRLKQRMDSALGEQSKRLDGLLTSTEDMFRFMKDNQMLTKLLELQNRLDAFAHVFGMFGSPLSSPPPPPPAAAAPVAKP